MKYLSLVFFQYGFLGTQGFREAMYVDIIIFMDSFL